MEGILPFQAPRPVAVEQQRNPWSSLAPNLLQGIIGSLVQSKLQQGLVKKQQEMEALENEKKLALQLTTSGAYSEATPDLPAEDPRLKTALNLAGKTYVKNPIGTQQVGGATVLSGLAPGSQVIQSKQGEWSNLKTTLFSQLKAAGVPDMEAYTMVEQAGQNPTMVGLADRASKGDEAAQKVLDIINKPKSPQPSFTDQKIIDNLTKKKGGIPPTDEEFLQAQAEQAGLKAEKTSSGRIKGEQTSIDPDTVKFYGDQILAGNPLSMGLGVAMRASVGKYVQEQMDILGESPDAVATRTNVRKSLAGSLTNQEKQIGMMDGFVNNINKQVDRLSELEKDLKSRTGLRALDLPIREIKMKAVGSGDEKIIEAYTTEISNEIAKLSTGSSASIRELSVEAQERWAKIHDPNLSFDELKKILLETKHMANMRISSSKEARDVTREQLGQIGGAGTLAKPSATPGSLGQISIDKAKEYMSKNGNGTNKKIVRTGKDATGRKVVQYDDGSIGYAD